MMIADTIKGNFQNKLSFNSNLVKRMILAGLIFALFTVGILAMSARQKGESFITIQVKIEAKITGRDPCDILSEWLDQAKQSSDTKLALTIETAEKFMGCRNGQKRVK